MAIPANPTMNGIILTGLKRGGRVTPTAAQITEAYESQFQEVKSDIMFIAPTHPLLEVTATTITTRGMQRYSIPPDCNNCISISLLDGRDEWRGTTVSASSTTITLAASMAGYDEKELIGKYVLITAGTGVEEYKQIIGYLPGSQLALLESAWTNTPTVSTYLIVSDHNQLWPYNVAYEFDHIRRVTQLGTPEIAAIFNQEYLLYPTPDKSTYGLLARYNSDLVLMDEASPLFIQLLREWRTIWIQGIAVKTMQRFDEDRYSKELDIYTNMLNFLNQQACGVTQVKYQDV